MSQGRLLAVDTGRVRVGLAVCDRDRTMASPYDLLTRKSAVQDGARFLQIIKEEQIQGIVVGLPIHMSGEEGTMANEARQYGMWLAGLTKLPVYYYDERCTSAAAESLLWDAGLTHKQRKERRDKLAAMLMLQSYLDAGCPTG